MLPGAGCYHLDVRPTPSLPPLAHGMNLTLPNPNCSFPQSILRTPLSSGKEDPGLPKKLTASLRCLASVLSLTHSLTPLPPPPCPSGKEDPGLAKKRREWQAKQDAEKAKEDAEKQQQQQQQAELQQAEAAAAAAAEGALVDPLAFAEDAAAAAEAAAADGVAAVDAAADGAAAAVVPEAAAAAGERSIVSEYTGEKGWEAAGGRAGGGRQRTVGM